MHKLDIALKELNETKVWLKMVSRAKLASEAAVQVVFDECQQLARLLNASVQTARRNAKAYGHAADFSSFIVQFSLFNGRELPPMLRGAVIDRTLPNER